MYSTEANRLNIALCGKDTEIKKNNKKNNNTLTYLLKGRF